MAKTNSDAATPLSKGGRGTTSKDKKDIAKAGGHVLKTPTTKSTKERKRAVSEQRKRKELKSGKRSLSAGGKRDGSLSHKPHASMNRKVKQELLDNYDQLFKAPTGLKAPEAMKIEEPRSVAKRTQEQMRGEYPSPSPEYKRNTTDVKKKLFVDLTDENKEKEVSQGRSVVLHEGEPDVSVETQYQSHETTQDKNTKTNTKKAEDKATNIESQSNVNMKAGSRDNASNKGRNKEENDTPTHKNTTRSGGKKKSSESAPRLTQTPITESTEYYTEDKTNTDKSKNKRVPNPYAKTAGNTPAKDDQTPLTWAQKVESPQTKIRTHERRFEAYDSYYEVTFQHQCIPSNYTMQEEIAVMRSKLKALLLRAKEIDRKAKINAWDDHHDLPTIVKVEDIPESPSRLKGYLSPLRAAQRLKMGRNSGWRVRITTKVETKEFVHYWSLTKKDFDKVEYLTLRDAPLQDSSYRAAGFFINSGDNQIVDELEAALSKELGFKIGIQYKPAALGKRAADDLWNAAKQAKYDAPKYEQNKAFFKHAPFAQQVYTSTRQQAHQAAIILSQKYGTPDKDGQYPRLPDGSRMRFFAASIYLDMPGVAATANLFPQQVRFATTEVVAPIPIRDPLQRFPTQGNKTMQQLILDLKDPEMTNEPYFRHVRKKYHWNFKCKLYEVSIHSQMYPRSAAILKDLKTILTETYDKEVGEALMSGPEETNDQTSCGGGMSGISIVTEDRYLNGPARFIIEGLEKVRADGGNTLQEIRQKPEDEETINIRSTTSGMTGDTGNTVPQSHESFADTVSYEHTPDVEMQAMLISEPDRSTQDDQSSMNNGPTSISQSSKRNGSDDGWTLHGSAKAAALLASKVAASVIPRGRGGEQP